MLGYFLLEPGISRKGSSSGSTGLKGRVMQSQVRHPGHGMTGDSTSSRVGLVSGNGASHGSSLSYYILLNTSVRE